MSIIDTSNSVSPTDAQGDGVFSAEDLASLTENRLLRKTLINALVGEKRNIPEDKAEKSLLVSLLNGVDSEIIGRARLKVAAKTDAQMTNLTGLVSQALLGFRVNGQSPTTPRQTKLPESIKLTNPVPGEMDQGVQAVSYEEIVK